MYSHLSSTGLEYIGADKMGQVPKGQSTKLTSGRAFDVIGNRKVLNYDRQRKSEEAVIEIKVTNAGNEEVDVLLIEHINGDWIIKDESLDYQKKVLQQFISHYPSNQVKQKVYTILTEKNGNKNLIEQSLELNSSISLIEGVGSVDRKFLMNGIFTINDLLFIIFQDDI